MLRDCILVLESVKDEKTLISQFKGVDDKIKKTEEEIKSLRLSCPYLNKSKAIIALNKPFDLKTLEYQRLVLLTILNS
jgi:hypothetical protein